MITFHNIGYMGRLGNQMFQFASTLGIGKKRGFDVKFPLENCTNHQMNGPIDLNTGSVSAVKCDLLECFDIPESYFIPTRYINPQYLYRENKFEYDHSTEDISDNTSLIGYFQTDRYFIDIRETIIDIFKFKDVFVEEGNVIMKEISQGKEIISLHIRRGDYTLYPDHHPTCDNEYYRKAISAIRERSGNDVKVIVFSDDKNWCMNNLSNFIDIEFVISPTNNPYVELYLMTLCNYHIIANSSFSWWGSWLSNSKITIAPVKWFGPLLNKNTVDIYCQNWIKI